MDQMTACAHCGELFEPSRADAKYHSARCRMAASRARTTAQKPITGPDSNESAVAALIEALEATGTFNAGDALPQLTLNLARAVDRNPGNSAMWGQLLKSEEELRAQVVAADHEWEQGQTVMWRLVTPCDVPGHRWQRNYTSQAGILVNCLDCEGAREHPLLRQALPQSHHSGRSVR